jgi:L-lactate dehydrogenase complex protein LldE
MKRVQLLGTCLGDLVFPDVLADAEELLREAGYDVVFPEGQVCCGQPAFNAGHRKAARRVAKTVVRAFSRDAPIVAPSGSCATMVMRHLPELVGAPAFEVWELSSFLDHEKAPVPRHNDGREVSYHDSCHMLRELGIRDAPRRLLLASGATIRPLPRPDLCCGFGGTFAVRQPEISVSMADDKLAGSAPVLVTADPGCLMHLHGRAQYRSALTTMPRVVHIATALARGVGRE